MDLPPQLAIHDLANVNKLKLYEPPYLKESVSVTHLDATIPDFQPPLPEDTLLNLLDSVKTQLIWWYAKALYPPNPSVFPNQHFSSNSGTPPSMQKLLIRDNFL